MRWTTQVVLGLVLCAVTASAEAGDIYVCKGADGVKRFQDVPCAKPAEAAGHQQYDANMARQPAPPAYVAPPPRAAEPPERYEASAYEPPPAPPSAYKCTAGRKTWVQMTPCPKTYTVFDPVDVSGYTNTGEHVNGFGTVRRAAPVQQQSLDRSELCTLVRQHVSMGQRRESLNAYERNKTGCGG